MHNALTCVNPGRMGPKSPIPNGTSADGTNSASRNSGDFRNRCAGLVRN